MKAVLKDGFEVEVREECLDDWDFLELLNEIDEGNGGKIVKVAKVMLGEEGTNSLKEHVKGTAGKASVDAMVGALSELLESLSELKN